MKKDRTFDAVRWMRGVRDKLSEKFSSMTYEEQKEYMEKELSSRPAESRGGR